MSQVAKWFDRKFEFVFPVELYPNLCARLRGTPVRLEEVLQGCTRERLVYKLDGKWSIQEHAGHLQDLESLWMARVQDYLAGGSQLTAADLRNTKTDQADHNRRSVGEIVAEFRSARSHLMNRVEHFDAAMFARSMLHPRLQQPMRVIDHLYFVAEHDDHHLARIWELKNAA
jgi:hypothetical protein